MPRSRSIFTAEEKQYVVSTYKGQRPGHKGSARWWEVQINNFPTGLGTIDFVKHLEHKFPRLEQFTPSQIEGGIRHVLPRMFVRTSRLSPVQKHIAIRSTSVHRLTIPVGTALPLVVESHSPMKVVAL